MSNHTTVDRIKRALKPLYYFTTYIEKDMVPIGQGYVLLENLKKQLDSLATNGNAFAKDLLSIVIRRWSTTAEEPMLKLAYFINKKNLLVWRNEYNTNDLIASGPASTQNVIDKIEQMKNEYNNIEKYTIKYAKRLGFNFSEAREEISFLIHFALPSHSRSHEDFWAGIRMSACNTVAHAKTMKIELSSEKVAGVATFYNYFLCLPSTEAYCERVFKNMRDLFDKKRFSSNDDLISAQTIIRMYILMKKEF